MKNIILSSVTIVSLFLANIVAALTVNNLSKYPISVGYSVCKTNGQCTSARPTIGAANSSNNRINILTSASDTFKISSALELDPNGKIIAQLNQPCSFKSVTQVFLNDNGTSKITCSAG